MRKRERDPVVSMWLWEQGVWVFGGALLVASLLILGGVYLVDRRLGRIEQDLTFEAKRQFQPADLAARIADESEAEALPIRRVSYVPIYSHAYYGGGRPYRLEATLSVRNVDPQLPIYLRSVRYYDTVGELNRTYVDRTVRLAPLETLEFLVPEHDTAGGSGANFLVEWRCASDAEPPLIEAVMMGVEHTQAVSFLTRGQILNRPAD